VTGADDGREARGAEPVDGDTGDGLRQSGEQRSHARHVAVVLARLVCSPEPDVLDLLHRHAGTRDRLADHDRREVVRPHVRERSAVAADRRADG